MNRALFAGIESRRDRYRDAVLGLNPIAYWRGGDGIDETGVYPLTGTFGVSPSQIPRSSRAAWDFNGSTQNMNGGDVLGGQFQGIPHTFIAWVNPDSTAGFPTIFSKRKTTPSNQGVILLLSGGAVVAQRWNAGVNQGANTTPFTLSTGVWYMIAMTHANPNLTVYVDAVQRAQNTGATTSLATTSPSDFSVGANATSTTVTNYFDGDIDEVAVFGYELSATDIKTLYDLGKP